jgi:hypothetical protein
MANQTVGVNVQDTNPYNFTLTTSGTLVGDDIELVINLTNVTSKEQVLLALDQFKLIFTETKPNGLAVLPP